MSNNQILLPNNNYVKVPQRITVSQNVNAHLGLSIPSRVGYVHQHYVENLVEGSRLQAPKNTNE